MASKKVDDNSLKYRRDSRTVEEFKKDLIEGSRIELEIVKRFCGMHDYKFEELGHDDGKIVTKLSSPVADFLINGEPVEVKFCRKHVSEFHMKTHHIESYVKQKAKLLFIMGWETVNPKYIFVNPEQFLDKPVVSYWNKLTFLCKTKDFEWSDLV